MGRDKNEIRSLWETFKEDIKHENRYFATTERTAGSEIINILDSYPQKLGLNCCGSMGFYRARIGKYSENKEMLAPEKNKATAGRCNAEGVSYLYLASSVQTAIAEVKPNKEDVVTVATIRIKNFRIFSIDVFFKNDMEDILNSLNNEVRFLLEIINDDFKNVVTVNKNIEYIPYQWLAEYIKYKQFDGFSYSSTLGKGSNYVIFNWEEKASVTNKELYMIDEVEYKSSVKK